MSAATWSLSARGSRRAARRLLGLGHCRNIHAEDVFRQAGHHLAEKLAATTGQPKPDITCPEDLAGKVGTTTRCTLTADDGSTLGVTVKVTSVDENQINFDFEADSTASPAPN
ncbi:DUF4333 domain-containing protein [Streptomyces plumbiresistens]|uniref:DUF4333 domain-containing protein n=1 Tax=Streptomyces plumbiresistens TaxID=511811 RepID=UPI003CD08455